MRVKIPVDHEKIAEFCRRWKITELSFFGSVLREDFGPESDVDVLVSFAPEAHWSLFDKMDMEEELEIIFGREVDLVSRRAIEQSRNWLRRETILSCYEVIHAG